METMLLAVTGLSLVLAAGMGVMLVRTLRIERRRSDARVALLEELAAARPETRVGAPPAVRPSTPRPSARSRSEHRASEVLLRTDTLDDFQLQADAGRGAAGIEIFEAHDAPSALSAGPPAPRLAAFTRFRSVPAAWPRRLALIGAMAAVVCAVFFGWQALDSTDSVPATRTELAGQTPGQIVAPAATPPLELLTLQHALQEGTLIISGVVLNPRGSAALAGVQATVVLFDASGGTLGSGRAPVDFTTLAPGDESSFVIRVPAAGAVTRYRVGFRGEDDRILGHMDRRRDETVARKQTP